MPIKSLRREQQQLMREAQGWYELSAMAEAQAVLSQIRGSRIVGFSRYYRTHRGTPGLGGNFRKTICPKPSMYRTE